MSSLLKRFALCFTFVLVLAGMSAGAQILPSIGRNANGTGNGSGLGIGSYDNKTVKTERVVTGRVLDKDGVVVKGATVYLKNDSTAAIKSVTVDETGHFRFVQLSRSVDYKLWAQHKDSKTEPKTISQFDTKDEISREIKLQ